MKKIFTLFAALMMVMSMSAKVVYLKLNDKWSESEGRYYVHVWGGSSISSIEMTAVEGEENMYQIEVGTNTNIIFIKHDPSANITESNKWTNVKQRIGNLTIPSSANCCTINSGEGWVENNDASASVSWSVYTPGAVKEYKDITITVTANATPKIHFWGGGDKVVGSEWETKPEMNPTGEANTYAYTIKDVDSSVGINYLIIVGSVQSPDQQAFENVTKDFKELLPQVAVQGVRSWDGTDKMTIADDYLSASITLPLTAGNYEWKLTLDNAWFGGDNYAITRDKNSLAVTDNGSNNGTFAADKDGDYVFTYTYATQILTVTYPELVPAVYKDITVTIGTAGFTGSTPTIKWWGAKGLANATEPQEMTATGFGGRYSYTFEQVDSVTGVNFYVELGGLRSKTITLHETPASYSQFYNILQNVYVKGGFNDWNDNDQLTKKSQDYKAISGIVQLKADTTYEFKITVNGDWYGNAQAITKDATTAKFADNDKNATITTTLAGGYTFTYNYLDSTLSVVYPVSVALDLGECTPAYNDEGIILESEDGTTVTIYNYQDGEYVHGDEIDVRASIEHNGKGKWDLFDGKGSWQVVNDVQNLVTTTLVNDDKTGYYTITATCALPQKHTLTLTGEYDVEEYGMGSITTFTATTEEDKALVVQISNEEGMSSIMGTLDDVHMTISETWEVVDGEDDTKTLTFTGTLSNGDTYDVTLTATKKVYPTVAIVNAEVTVDGTSLVMTGKLYEQTVTCTIWEYKGEGNYEWLEIVSDDDSIYWGGVTPAELTEDGTNYTLTGVFTDYSEKYNVIFTTKSVATSLDNVEMGTAPVKVIENGQLIIIRDGVQYNAQGAVVQ